MYLLVVCGSSLLKKVNFEVLLFLCWTSKTLFVMGLRCCGSWITNWENLGGVSSSTGAFL